MRRISSILPFLLMIPFLAEAQPAAPSESPRTPYPIVVLVEYDPWLWLIGSDSPTFALYDDRTVIYRDTGRGPEYRYLSVRISEEEFAEIGEAMRYSELKDLGEFYSITTRSSQPRNTITFIGDENRYVQTTVYGPLRPFGDDNDSIRLKAPDEFRRAFDLMTGFRHPDARPWMPEHVELVMVPMDSSSHPPKRWPETWPDLDDPRTVDRGRMISIYLPSALYSDYREFASEGERGEPILMSERLWAVYARRMPFPLEQMWMR